MSSQQLVELAIHSGCEVIDYGSHFYVRKSVDVSVSVTIPNVAYLAAQLVAKIRAVLGL